MLERELDAVTGIGRIAFKDCVNAAVAGHGEQVGALALSLRKIMRKHINTPDQTKLTRQLNEEFSHLSASGKFATAVLGTYYGPAHSLILSNAGHPPPLWHSSSENQWRLLTPDVIEQVDEIPRDLANLPLGIIEPTAYEQFIVQVGVGDTVVFYTDSLIEAMDASGLQLGPEGLLDLAQEIGSSSPASLCDALLDRVGEFRHATEADDDVTLVVLQQNAGEPPPKSLGFWVDTLGRLVTGR